MALERGILNNFGTKNYTFTEQYLVMISFYLSYLIRMIKNFVLQGHYQGNSDIRDP